MTSVETSPLVSVVMPCRNAERYIREAIDSILAQTYPHFEFLIIDNASSDSTGDIVREYQERDDRITYLRNPEDIRISGSLNRGLKAAKGEFVARMDADDLALPDRIEKQLAYLQSHPECILCGSNIYLIDEHDARIGKRDFPVGDEEIKRRMLLEIPFCHPATLFRREPVIANEVFYDTGLMTVEDRDFWLRLADHGAYANLEDYLMYYRVSENSMKYTECRRTLIDIVKLQIKYCRQPRFRGPRILFVIASECVLLLFPRRFITFLYRLKYSV